MPILDKDGRLFGVINIVDVMVLLMAIAVVVAGVALVTGAEPEKNPATEETTTETLSITYRLEAVPEFLPEPIEIGPVKNNDALVAVTNKSVVERSENETVTVDITVETRVTKKNGLTYYNGERIYVGKQITLDLGHVVVNPIVIRMS